MSLAAILKRLDAIERKVNMNRDVGNWVRSYTGAVIWDRWDMDAPPEFDPLPGLLDDTELTAERLRSQPGWTEPTEAQKVEAVRAFDEMIERMRAERQAIRDFTAFVEGKLAEGVPLAEI
jgi:hypothetical protein